MRLADTLRELASRELKRYGTLSSVSSTTATTTSTMSSSSSVPHVDGEYGHYLASNLNNYMASCVVEDSVRSLCSVGLIATVDGGSGRGSRRCCGYLWLVDATGFYPCRAHAVGRGSDRINRRLAGAGADGKTTKTTTNFEEMSVEEGAQALLDIVVREIGDGGGSSSYGDHRENGDSKDEWTLPLGTRVEIAVLDSNRRKMRRLRQPLLASLETYSKNR